MIIDTEKLSEELETDFTSIALSPGDYQIMVSETDDDEPVVQIEDNDLENDFQTARENLISVIESGARVLESAENFATQTEAPKSVEAFSALLNNLANASLTLLELHKRKKDIKGAKKEETDKGNSGNNGNITNNNIAFVGSPSDLRKFLNDTANTDK